MGRILERVRRALLLSRLQIRDQFPSELRDVRLVQDILLVPRHFAKAHPALQQVFPSQKPVFNDSLQLFGSAVEDHVAVIRLRLVFRKGLIVLDGEQFQDVGH